MDVIFKIIYHISLLMMVMTAMVITTVIELMVDKFTILKSAIYWLGSDVTGQKQMLGLGDNYL